MDGELYTLYIIILTRVASDPRSYATPSFKILYQQIKKERKFPYTNSTDFNEMITSEIGFHWYFSQPRFNPRNSTKRDSTQTGFNPRGIKTNGIQPERNSTQHGIQPNTGFNPTQESTQHGIPPNME